MQWKRVWGAVFTGDSPTQKRASNGQNNLTGVETRRSEGMKDT